MATPWTDKARKAIALAIEATRRAGESRVTPADLLAGLLELPRSVARDVLRRAGLAPKALREALARSQPDSPQPAGTMPVLSSEVENIIDHAERIAQRRRIGSVGTDLILAVILERTDPAVEAAFRQCGGDAAALRRQLMGQLQSAPQQPREERPGAKPMSFEETVSRCEPDELIARVISLYEREKQAAVRRDDFAAAAQYRDRIRKLKGLLREPPK